VEPSRTTENPTPLTGRAYHRDAKLLTLAELAIAAGVDPIARETRALAERVAQERFFVACVGATAPEDAKLESARILRKSARRRVARSSAPRTNRPKVPGQFGRKSSGLNFCASNFSSFSLPLQHSRLAGFAMPLDFREVNK
jgi:hypothetical protein